VDSGGKIRDRTRRGAIALITGWKLPARGLSTVNKPPVDHALSGGPSVLQTCEFSKPPAMKKLHGRTGAPLVASRAGIRSSAIVKPVAHRFRDRLHLYTSGCRPETEGILPYYGWLLLGIYSTMQYFSSPREDLFALPAEWVVTGHRRRLRFRSTPWGDHFDVCRARPNCANQPILENSFESRRL